MNGRIAFLGTGIMGAPMAVNLLKAGFELSCYNRSRAKTAPVVEAGGVACENASEAARGVATIITMVTDGPDVENLLFGPQGALESAAKGALCIDMSTISPALTRDLAKRAMAGGRRYIDAPVTGGEPGARNATLSIMVGGLAADFEAARPIFTALGKTITHCGPVGSGQSVKLCNQICGAMNLLGVCEALVLGERLGIDPAIVVEVVGAGAGNSWAMQNLAPRIVRHDYAPGFMIDTQQKDMRLVAAAAEEAAVALPGAALAQQLWRSAQAHGDGRDGIQGMMKVLERLSNSGPHGATDRRRPKAKSTPKTST